VLCVLWQQLHCDAYLLPGHRSKAVSSYAAVLVLLIHMGQGEQMGSDIFMCATLRASICIQMA